MDLSLLFTLLLSAIVMAVLIQMDFSQPSHPRPIVESGERRSKVHVHDGSFLVETRIGDHWTYMLLDTGFGGTPLLSLPLLAEETGKRVSPSDHSSFVSSCGKHDSKGQETALTSFLSKLGCASFTGGCTQRLNGIGSSETMTTDTLLTPPVQFVSDSSGLPFGPRHVSGMPSADIFSTTTMQTTHILTLDVLRQSSPCLLSPREGTLTFSLRTGEMRGERPTFTALTSTLRGGSFVCKAKVGGTDFELADDTGASTYVSLGEEAARRIRDYDSSSERHMVQIGVGEEKICSDVVAADVTVSDGISFSSVPICLNDTPSGDVDGYIGACFLECLDMLITKDELLIRRNGEMNATLLDHVLLSGKCGVR